MLLGGTFFLVTALVTAQFLPDKMEAEPLEREKFSKTSIRQLLSVGAYRKLIAILFLIGVSIAKVPFIDLAGKMQKLSLRFRYLLMTGLPLCAYLFVLFAHGTYMIFCDISFKRRIRNFTSNYARCYGNECAIQITQSWPQFIGGGL